MTSWNVGPEEKLIAFPCDQYPLDEDAVLWRRLTIPAPACMSQLAHAGQIEGCASALSRCGSVGQMSGLPRVEIVPITKGKEFERTEKMGV